MSVAGSARGPKLRFVRSQGGVSKRDEPQDRQRDATSPRPPGTVNRRGGAKPRGRHRSGSGDPGPRPVATPAETRSRRRTMEGRTGESQERRPATSDLGPVEPARVERRLRRGGEGHGGAADRATDRASAVGRPRRPVTGGARRQRAVGGNPHGTTVTEEAGKANDPLPRSVVGKRYRLDRSPVSRCLHRACPTGPGVHANLMEAAWSARESASGDPLRSSNL